MKVYDRCLIVALWAMFLVGVWTHDWPTIILMGLAAPFITSGMIYHWNKRPD